MRHKRKIGFFERGMVKGALSDTFRKLNPRNQVLNPVIFVTFVGAIFATLVMVSDWWNLRLSWFDFQISLWLWFTVLFANFSEALAESHGKAHAESLRQVKVNTQARVLQDGKETKLPAHSLSKGDIVVCEVGDIIPADGDVIEGIATVDESAITGESAPVIRESGGDRCAVTNGTVVLSDRIVIEVTSEPGESFLDRIIALIEGSQRQKTPNEIALNIVLSGLTLVFLWTLVSLKFFADYSAKAAGQDISTFITPPVFIALLVCLIPTTISALLSAVGISGIDRLTQLNVIAKSGRAVEAAGDVDVLILDKTGTITLGNRVAYEFIPAEGASEKELAEVAQLASMADETPEGRSIVILAKKRFELRGQTIETAQAQFRPFSAKTRMSGVDFFDPQGKLIRSVRKGASDAIKDHIEKLGGIFPLHLDEAIEGIAKQGGTPLVVSDHNRTLGIIHLKDVIKGGIRDRFDELRKIGIRTIMITGDNPLTAAAIAAESGVDDFVAEATPEMKLDLIRREQKEGRLVAMTGDGVNDAPALAQADVGLAMNTGTQATREASNMIDLDSNPTKLVEVVTTGKQMLMTRGALTTFSIANDIAKYFAIIPAIFAMLYASKGEIYGPLYALNLMHLNSPHSAILSAVIFNALIIIGLIPLALRGVKYRAESSANLLRKNLFIYGLGGIVIPFVGIKLIDMLIVMFGVI